MDSQRVYTGKVIGKILLGFGTLVLFTGAFSFASIKYNESMEPPQLMVNFVDLNKVSRISKFRSCAGHTTVPKDGREMKRNMKHYIGLYPEYQKENFVEIYAPYDGYIALILNEEIWIAPERKSLLSILPINLWMFSVEHVKPREGMRIGNKVKAGEVIGYGTFLMSEPGYATFDAVYGTMSIPPKKVDNYNSPFGDLDSIFNHMSEEVIAEYEQKGVTRENIIVSKEERDNDPCVYRDGGPYFGDKVASNEWVELK